MTVTVREALEEDTERLSTFLCDYNETSMFLRGNLNDYGIGNIETQNAMRYFIREIDGKITGVGAISNSRSLMVQAPEGLTEICAYMKSILPDDTEYSALLGDTQQAGIMRKEFGLQDAATTMDDVEPLYALKLEDLIVPSIDGMEFRKTEMSDLPLLADWEYAYDIETGLRKAGDDVREESGKDAAERIKKNRSRLLCLNGKPVAHTGFNAVLPDSVQIGGVYTPKKNRRKGYARLAVALHLEEVRAQGVDQAILFSANEFASRAYISIGFKHIGQYSLVLFDNSNQPSD